MFSICGQQLTPASWLKQHVQLATHVQAPERLQGTRRRQQQQPGLWQLHWQARLPLQKLQQWPAAGSTGGRGSIRISCSGRTASLQLARAAALYHCNRYCSCATAKKWLHADSASFRLAIFGCTCSPLHMRSCSVPPGPRQQQPVPLQLSCWG